jgi:hypothetical protein
MSRLSLTAGAGCVLLAAALTNAQTAQEPPWVKLVHSDTGKVVSVAGKSEEPAARVVLDKDDGSEFQQWKFVKDGNYSKVVNRKTGQVLDVFEESLDEGTEIIQWPDKEEGNDNQRWSWEGEGKDRRLKSKSSSLVLDVVDGTKIVQKKSDTKVKGQLWQVVEIKK